MCRNGTFSMCNRVTFSSASIATPTSASRTDFATLSRSGFLVAGAPSRHFAALRAIAIFATMSISYDTPGNPWNRTPPKTSRHASAMNASSVYLWVCVNNARFETCSWSSFAAHLWNIHNECVACNFVFIPRHLKSPYQLLICAFQ